MTHTIKATCGLDGVRRSIANACSIARLTALGAMAVAPAFAAQGAPSADSAVCYLSREYRAGVRDRALVSVHEASARIDFQLTYCNFAMSPDCTNARSEELEVRGNVSGDLVRAKSADGSCAVNVRFLNDGARALVSQESTCPQIKYWGPHGVYVPEMLGPGEESACQR